MKDFRNFFNILNEEKRVVILKDKPVDTASMMANWLATKMMFKKTVVAYFDAHLNHVIRQAADLIDDNDIKEHELFRLELNNGSMLLDGKWELDKKSIKPDIIVFNAIQDSDDLRHKYWDLEKLLCDEDVRVIFIGYGDYYGVSDHENNHVFADIYWSGHDTFNNKYKRVRIVADSDNTELLIDKA